MANQKINLKRQIESTEKSIRIFQAKQASLLEKAAYSEHPSDIIKATNMLSAATNIQSREASNRKSYIIDPFLLQDSFGYKARPSALSFGTLRRMAKTPIFNAIIKTRVDQVADFCVPQRDEFSTGFVIQKKQRFGQKKKDLQKEDYRRIEFITEFLLNCGQNHSWTADDFEGQVRKFTKDSLEMDAAAIEVVRKKNGIPYETLAVDAATIRVAESYDDETYQKTRDSAPKVKGYFPSYVQIQMEQVFTEFYPWELCYGIRNPSSSILLNGYGTSELEDLVNVVTSMLWADEYNRKFFSQGSSPKGILRIKNSTNSGINQFQINENKLAEFRQYWLSMVSGVQNSWRTPILEGDVDWLNLQMSNNDMQFGQWQEYLIKLGCAMYRIDPSEIKFPLSGSSDQRPMFEGNNEARLTHSRDSGLRPLLKFIQARYNKFVISQLDPNFELVFSGLDTDSQAEKLQMAVQKVSSFATLNEVRKENGYEEIKDDSGIGDMILNPAYLQAKQMQQQQEMMDQQGQQQMGMGSEGVAPGQQEEDQQQNEEDNPITKAFNNYIDELNNSGR